MICSSVVLPEPEGPTIVSSSPRFDVEVDARERANTAGILLHDTAQLDQRHGQTPALVTVMPSASPSPSISTKLSV